MIPLEVRIQSAWQKRSGPVQLKTANICKELISTEGVIIFMSFMMWAWTPVYGMNLFVAATVSDIINGIFKWFFCRPRPFWQYPDQVKNIGKKWEKDYSFPSGHAQAVASIAFSL